MPTKHSYTYCLVSLRQARKRATHFASSHIAIITSHAHTQGNRDAGREKKKRKKAEAVQAELGWQERISRKSRQCFSLHFYLDRVDTGVTVGTVDH